MQFKFMILVNKINDKIKYYETEFLLRNTHESPLRSRSYVFLVLELILDQDQIEAGTKTFPRLSAAHRRRAQRRRALSCTHDRGEQLPQ